MAAAHSNGVFRKRIDLIFELIELCERLSERDQAAVLRIMKAIRAPAG